MEASLPSGPLSEPSGDGPLRGAGRGLAGACVTLEAA